MALDSVEAWATRWRESAGNPFDRGVQQLRVYDDESEEITLFTFYFFLNSELMVTPMRPSESTLIAPEMIAGTIFVVPHFRIVISLVFV